MVKCRNFRKRSEKPIVLDPMKNYVIFPWVFKILCRCLIVFGRNLESSKNVPENIGICCLNDHLGIIETHKSTNKNKNKTSNIKYLPNLFAVFCPQLRQKLRKQNPSSRIDVGSIWNRFGTHWAAYNLSKNRKYMSIIGKSKETISENVRAIFMEHMFK